MNNKIITVIGATSSGKTQLAHKLAHILNGEIISADSVSIYKHLDIFSNKPSPEEQIDVKYHLLSLITPDLQYNSGQFKRATEKCVPLIKKRQKCPIICGGTPLYIKSFFYGLIDVPGIPDDIKQSVADKYNRFGLNYCFKLLSEKDPQTADRLNPNDTQRILRAMEVIEAGNGSITEYQNAQGFLEKNYEPVYLMPNTDRETVYNNINRRSIEMIKNGGIEETKRIIEMGYSSNCPGLRNIGYKQAVQYLNGELVYSQLAEEIAKHTRHYAKRQFTWYRKYTNIRLVSPNIDEKDLADLLKTI